LPADTELRIGAFTELMATAIANSDARTEIERLAGEQAALRHVATLVVRGAETREVFAAVAREVSQVMRLPVAAVQRYEDDGTTTVTAAWIANTQSRTELSASRARIVAAADETRRRIERDLHDGIQQRLVALALKARTIETMTPPPADEIQGELSRLADGLGTAMDELREISHGIYPPILSESGLGPALEALARRSAVPVELDLNLGPRLGQHVEAAGYYIASEAITNAAKHAQASVIDVCADARDGVLTFSISDDGIGGADPGRGSGIIGLRDRVEALGGTILVLSPPGQGTTLHVQRPAGPAAGPTPPGGTP
jgi:signal transduction histidine kinase